MTTIWHNPRCSKSRQTLALLHAHGETPDIRLYAKNAPTEAELREVCARLGIAPIALMRTGEALFRDLGLARTDPDETLIAAMTAHPELIERPVVLKGSKAALGRPPEAVLKIL